MEETKKSYRECAKTAPCKGLKSGTKGYRVCLDEKCVSEKKLKAPKSKILPPKTTDKNPWLKHIAMYRIKHPELSYKDAMKNARQSYTPIKK